MEQLINHLYLYNTPDVEAHVHFCYTQPHTFKGAEVGRMSAVLLPAVPGVLCCDAKPAADGHAAALTWVQLVVPVGLGVTW